MTVSPALDARFREAAAAAGLLDVAYDLAETPIGTLLVATTDRGLCRISYDPEPEREAESLAQTFGLRVLRAAKPIDPVRRQLDEYFEGKRTEFELPIDLRHQALDDLRRVGCGGAPAQGRAGRRHGDEPEPGSDRAALPPRGRCERLAHRLRRRAGAQGAPARARGRDSASA